MIDPKLADEFFLETLNMLTKLKSPYKLCKKHKLLRVTRNHNTVVSTSALRELLGEERYQECRLRFKYKLYSGPDPYQVEQYLKEKKYA